MKVPPSVVGARAEAAVASALVRAGMMVYLPAFGGHSRVDLVYDDGARLVRVQCKNGRLAKGALSFATCSYTANRPKTYVGEVDEFGVYAPALDRVYLVPAVDLPTRLASLRLTAAKNGQQEGVRWASDYVLGPP
jgi:hypothetical protein